MKIILKLLLLVFLLNRSETAIYGLSSLKWTDPSSYQLSLNILCKQIKEDAVTVTLRENNRTVVKMKASSVILCDELETFTIRNSQPFADFDLLLEDFCLKYESISFLNLGVNAVQVCDVDGVRCFAFTFKRKERGEEIRKILYVMSDYC